MVDFQSRDTRRGFGDDASEADDAPEEGPGDSAPDAEEADATEGDSGTDRPSEGDPDTVTYAVVTVAAGGSLDDDPVGEGIVDAIEASGGAVVTRELLAPSYDGVQTAVGALVGRGDVDAVVTAGGTGVEPTDVTVDAVEDIFDKRLPGFGELFRALSQDSEGTAVVRTRATAGLIDDAPVFCLPGDPESARRGAERIVVEEAGPLAAQASDGADDPA